MLWRVGDALIHRRKYVPNASRAAAKIRPSGTPTRRSLVYASSSVWIPGRRTGLLEKVLYNIGASVALQRHTLEHTSQHTIIFFTLSITTLSATVFLNTIETEESISYDEVSMPMPIQRE